MAKAWEWIKLHLATVAAVLGGILFTLAFSLLPRPRKAEPVPAVLDPTKALAAERARASALAQAGATAQRRATVEAAAVRAGKPSTQETAVGEMTPEELAAEWKRLKG